MVQTLRNPDVQQPLDGIPRAVDREEVEGSFVDVIVVPAVPADVGVGAVRSEAELRRIFELAAFGELGLIPGDPVVHAVVHDFSLFRMECAVRFAVEAGSSHPDGPGVAVGFIDAAADRQPVPPGDQGVTEQKITKTCGVHKLLPC